MQTTTSTQLKESLIQRVRADAIAKATTGAPTTKTSCSLAKTSEECKSLGPSCEWAPTPFLGRLFSRSGKCREVPIFELYVRAVCSSELEEYEGPELYKNELKRISTRFGYTIEDFGAPRGGWKDVTRKQICERVKKDVLKASEIVSSSSSGSSAPDIEAVKKALNMEGRDVVFERMIRYATYRSLKSGGNFYETIDYVSTFLKENKRFVIVNLFAICFIVYGIYENYSYFSSLKFSPYTGGSVTSLSDVQIKGYVPLSESAKIGEYRSSILDFYGGGGGNGGGSRVERGGGLDVIPLIEYADLNKREGCSILLNEAATVAVEAATTEMKPQPRPQPETFEDYEEICKMGIENESLFIEDVIADIQRYDATDDLSSREDFKEWGLLPGQPIFYRGAFGTQHLAHYGVYVGKGLVAEVGMGPAACGKTTELKSSFLTRSKAQSTGLSTLENFVSRAGGKKEQVIFISSPEDSSKEKAIERLQRIPQFIGEMSYNAVVNNCEGFANAVAFGMNVATGSVQARTALLLATFVVTATDTAIMTLRKKWNSSRKKKIV